ncbi:MAG: phosphate ABC transporter substrate-binding protein [Gammaproteobacteria bacterium]|nr:phosphate ABC transporter substrate-binding protein [Gammaproteobacteria bacterium]
MMEIEKLEQKAIRLFFSGGTSVSNADLAIIAHPDYEGGELNEEMVRELFLRETTSFPSGHKAVPANHSVGSPDRKDFFKYVLKMGEVRHKRPWSRKVSTGKKGAPEELSNYDDLLKWVANTPLSIAYIDKNKVNDSVKVLLAVYVFDDI